MISVDLVKREALSPSSSDDVSMFVEEFVLNLDHAGSDLQICLVKEKLNRS